MPLPLVALLALAPTDLTFVRHAETVANASGSYNAQTLNAFSDKGRNQVEALTEALLARPRFDVVLVSPSPRALATIAPYLAETGQLAVVWPLLYECCTGKRTASKATSFTWGAKIRLPQALAAYFRVMPGRDRLPVSPGWGPGLAQVAASVKEFQAKYAGKRVLLVGHSGHGGLFLRALTGKRLQVDNAKPYSFRLP